MHYIFWISFGLIIYVYVLYPVLIYILSHLFPLTIKDKPILPSVSIIITAYNEQKHIGKKIENTLSLDYPREKLEIIVGSDGSTDSTNEIVKEYEANGIKLIAFPANRGKTLTQNDCVHEANFDLIVFMDAASMCDKAALKKIVRHFADPSIGAVAGKIEYVKSMDNLVSESQGIYWKYEQFLKNCENRIGSLIGVDGPLYAIRKALYRPLSADMISDLITPLLVRVSGQYVLLENEAVTYEETTTTTQDEFITRRRIVLRGLIGLFRYPQFFNPFKNILLSWQIISHKILRWMVGIFFILMFASAMLLINNLFYLTCLVCMTIILLLSFIGLFYPGANKTIFSLPYYFVLVNTAALLGLVDFLRGNKIISWKPTRA